MALSKITKGYQNEVAFQKKMLQNLQYWLQFFLSITAIGFILIYYYYGKTEWLFIIGIILTVAGLAASSIIAYGRHRGKQNIKRIIIDYQNKVEYFKLQNDRHNK